jgi:predicted transcriptional regulator
MLHNAYGNTHQYYPIVPIEDYRKRFMSTVTLISLVRTKIWFLFFAKEEKISAAELREILAMIENQEATK